MKSIIYTFFIALVTASLISPAQSKATSPPGKMDIFISALMKKMTLIEKLGQLNLSASGDITTGQISNSNVAIKIKEGKMGGLFNIKSAEKIRAFQYIAVEESRLKIPLLFGMDVIHGYQTAFPIPLGLSCSWDIPLIEESARMAAKEASADGICWTFSPMVDISRDPRWGRVSEGSGEDPFLGSAIAKAMVRGYQGEDLSQNNTILSCVKHFALYGASEGGRDYNTTDMSRIRMYNEYIAPYKAAIEAGAGSVMSSFNEIDGIPATANKWLMTELLRDKWGFNGFVVTDYTAINELTSHGLGDLQNVSALALQAGIDMDMVGEGFLTTLSKSLEEGKVTLNQIDQACYRILAAKYKLGLFDDPYRYCDSNRAKTEIFTEKTRKFARETATKSFVLLKNENQTLPLQRKGTIAVIGPMAANKENMIGTWSVAAIPSQAVSLLEGIKNVVNEKTKIVYALGSNVVEDSLLDKRINIFGKPTYFDLRSQDELIKEALNVAGESDVIIAAMGESAEMSGESSSRTDIALPGNQQKLLMALLATGKPVIMVLFTGRPLTLNWEDKNIPAILNVWFAGSEAGNAISDVLFGLANPSGKLSMTFPQNVGQIPLYYNHKNTGRPLEENGWFTKFRSNYLDVSNDPLYPFGYGLSYTTFEYGNFHSSSKRLKGNQTLTIDFDLTNSGNYDGAEVVQMYIRDLVGNITHPVKELKGFQKVYLKKGETKRVVFKITPENLKFYNNELIFDWESGEFVAMIGGNSRDTYAVSFHWEK